MFYYFFSGLINAITSTVLGLFVYFRNRNNPINKSFALFCATVAMWSWAYIFWPGSRDGITALFWFRTLMVGAIFIPIFYLNFVLNFINKFQEKKKILFFGYIVFIFFFFANFTPFFVKDVTPKLNFPYWPNPGILYHPFLLLWFFYVVYSLFLLIQESITVTGARKNQIKYILIGTIIGYAGGITNYFLWYDIPIPPLGNGLVAFYVILTAIAILKYHLFEIRVILTEILVGVMGVILLLLPFVMSTTSLKIATVAIFILFLVIGYLLIKATHKEIKKREEIERFVGELRNINKSLEEKITKSIQELQEEKKLTETFREIAEERARRLERVYTQLLDRE